MRRTFSAFVFATSFALVTLASATSHAASALNDGDIVIPGEGCLWKMGSPPTAWLVSNAFGWATDAMEDSQGRIVFIAGAGNNVNSVALFRADPAIGTLERLQMLPYIVMAGDTLPERGGAAGYYGETQSLHLEKRFQMTLDDHTNNGIPQVGQEESYVFSIGASVGGQMRPMAIRWLVDRNAAEQGIDVSAINIANGVAMAADGYTTYYGASNTVFKAGPQLEIDAHFSLGGLGTLNANLQITPSNDPVFNNDILDDTNVPNVTATCGNITDTDVPMNGGGFAYLTIGTLGMMGGSLYSTTNYAPAGTPYQFRIARRNPFLNPYICQFYTAVTFAGGTPWLLGDTLGTTPDRGESSDGGSVLANADGNILSVSPGSVGILSRNAAYRGRPLHWHAPAAPLAGGLARAQAVGDTSLCALVVRVDSLVRLVVTDPLGKRIGVNAADSVVNDFGKSGLVSALGTSGWPKLVTIVGPEPGNYHVDFTGAAAGEYGSVAYIAETSTGGAKSVLTDAIGAGESQHRILQVLPPMGIAWLPASTAVNEPSLADAPGFDSVGPLPTTATVRFACHAPASNVLRLEVFDLSGRRVATLADRVHSGGQLVATWSGCDDAGRRLPAGVYLARLSVPGASAVHRVVMMR